LIKGAKVFQIEMFLNTEDQQSKPNSLAVMIVVQHIISAVRDFEQKL
jgi:hypothetical protein